MITRNKKVRAYWNNNSHLSPFLTQFKKVLRATKGSPLGVRIRMLGRLITCPYGAILQYLPKRGKILEVGCGDGLLLWLAAQRPLEGSWEALGIDLDEKRVKMARALENERLHFQPEEICGNLPQRFDCVILVDVLYCIALENWKQVLEDCFQVLRPHGLLVIKELVDTPRWKYWWAYFQEILAVKVFKITIGAHPHIESIQAYRTAIQKAGFTIPGIARLDACMPHGHCLFISRKPLDKDIPHLVENR